MKKIISLIAFVFTLNIVSAQISISPTTVDTGYCQHNYYQKITASGGRAPYSYTISAGALPANLSLNKTTGVISGICNVYNDSTVNFTVRATDALSATATRAYTLNIRNKRVTWTTLWPSWNEMPNTYPDRGEVYDTYRLFTPPSTAVSGTIGNYSKFTSANAVGNALLIDKGRYVTLPSGKRFGDADTTKSYINFGSTGATFSCISPTGSFTTSAATASSTIAGTSISNTAGTTVSTTAGTNISNTATAGNISLSANAGNISNGCVDYSITATDDFSLSVTDDAIINATSDLSVSAGGDMTISGTDDVSLTVGGDLLQGVELTYTGTFGGDAAYTYGASRTESIAGNYVVTVDTLQVVGAVSFTTNIFAANKTINTTAGDAATINAAAGRFRKDASGAAFTLTNSLITANSIIMLTPANASIDATATTWTISAGAGSATITFNAAPTANFDMNFIVIN